MHHGMTWGRELWTVILIVISLEFAIPEGIALLTNWSNTLSDYARTELSIQTPQIPLDQHTLAWFLSLFITVVTMGWLVYHVWFEVGFSV